LPKSFCRNRDCALRRGVELGVLRADVHVFTSGYFGNALARRVALR
jgi:hypothetical protein